MHMECVLFSEGKERFLHLLGVSEWSIYLVCLPAALSSELGHVGPQPASLFAQLHLSWIISWPTPDTSVSLTGRLPTVALPNGPRPSILQVSIVELVQSQTPSNWAHMFSTSSDPPAGQQLRFTDNLCVGSAIITHRCCWCGSNTKAQLFSGQKVENSDVFTSETYKHGMIQHFDHVRLRQPWV